MTQTVYSWMRGVACYYLVYSIVMNLISDRQYQNYVKSFMGMILVIMILTPIFQLFRSDLNLSDILMINEMKREWQELKNTAVVNEEKTNTYILEACKVQMEEQIQAMAEQHELHVLQADLEFEYETELIWKRMKLTLEPYTQTSQVNALKNDLQEVYGIDPSHISIDIR